MLFRTRDLFVRQRTQLINALRALLAEHGVIAPQGIASLSLLAETVEDHNLGLDFIAVETARLYLDLIGALFSDRVAGKGAQIESEAFAEYRPPYVHARNGSNYGNGSRGFRAHHGDLQKGT